MSPEQQQRAHALARGIAGMSEDAGVRLLAQELVALLGADTPKTSAAAMDARPLVPSLAASAHPEAVRSRGRRAARRQAGEAQLELAPVATGRDRSATATPPLSQDPNPPPNLKKIRTGSPPAPTAYDADQPPPWLEDVAREVRSDISPFIVTQIWRSFCVHMTKRLTAPKPKRHADYADFMQHWRNFVRKEDLAKRQLTLEAWAAAGAPRPPTTPAAPPSAVEPLEHPDDIIYTAKPAELAKAQFRAVPPAMLAEAMRTVPPDLEADFADFAELFPLRPPEPRSMSA